MIKKGLMTGLILLVAVIFSMTVLAETEINPDSRKSSLENIRAGGGVAWGAMKLNLSELNELLVDNGFAKLDNTIITYGGGGIGGNKKGHRFGGFGTGGSVSSVKNDKKAFLNVGYGGFLYEKGIYAENKIDVAIGGIIGGGGMKLTLLKDKPGSFAENIKDVDHSNSVTMEKGFIALKPRANLHYQFLDKWGISLNAGYLFTFDTGEGFAIGDKTISKGKLSNFSAPVINLQVSYGF